MPLKTNSFNNTIVILHLQNGYSFLNLVNVDSKYLHHSSSHLCQQITQKDLVTGLKIM
jgi:hypothetical protein